MQTVRSNLIIKNKLFVNSVLKNSKITNLLFVNCTFRNITFSSTFSKTKFENCQFQGCIFEFDSNWNKIRFIDCIFSNNLLFPNSFKQIYFKSNKFYWNLTNNILENNKFIKHSKGLRDISSITWGYKND